MPSFDVVSEVDTHELTNAVDQANRELSTRFDFKGVEAEFVLEDSVITQSAPSDFQLQQMTDILRQRLTALRTLLPDTPPAALLFTCNGRGQDMFRAPHHDSGVVGELLPGAAVAGMFCNGEIGPAGPTGEPTLHGFTATLALLIPDEA